MGGYPKVSLLKTGSQVSSIACRPSKLIQELVGSGPQQWSGFEKG